MRTEQEVNELIDNLVKRTKGKYITQGCSFNKNCPRQMQLLKFALMQSVSFSGLMKELLAVKVEGASPLFPPSYPSMQIESHVEGKKQNVGNFI